MDSLSVSLSLTNRKCLIIGSQPQAIMLAQALSLRQAHVVVVSPQPVTLTDDIVVLQRDYKQTDLDDCWLVIAATPSAADNLAIKKACDQQRLFCSVTGDSSNSSWITSDVQPVPADSDQADSDTAIELDSFQSQSKVKNEAASATGSLANSDFSTEAESFAASKRDERVGQSSESPANIGVVSLVGAGPGDPELLTVRALSRIQSADAVVYDRLVSKPILALCNPHAEFVYAGKAKANHALPQNSINQLLVDLARRHQRVVRLKGGDPFIFGRGGEEIETLAEQQVVFEVVPGITAASGCAAFSGIPLTHRDHAQSCIFVTGHLRNGSINLNWQELTDPQQTIVVYMGLTGLDGICKSLIEHGRSSETPAALIEQGTKPEQRVLASTLGELPDLVASSDVVAPTLLIIGGVVSLRDKLRWFEPDHSK